MATLPAANYLSNAARTEAEMQTALDALRDVVAEIGSTAPTTRTISLGAMPVPTSSMALVQSEGHASGADDVLATITTTGIDQGRIVILRNANTASSEAASSEKITISHGTSAGQIELADNASFILCAERLIALVYSGDHWVELWRNYGRKNAEDSLAERTDLGLGTASVETIATTSGAGANSKVLKVGASASIATDAILAMDASGNIKAGTVTGGNADTLDTYDSSAFVRKADTSTHALAASVVSTSTGSTRFNANTTGTAQNPGFGMLDDGTARGLIYTNSSSGSFNAVTYDSSGVRTALTPAIRLNQSNARLEFSYGSGGAYESLRPGPGNGLDADTVDGIHASALLNVLSIVNGASGGSFRLSDGTTTLLVQWPGNRNDFINTGGNSPRRRWTFPIAYSAPPFVLGTGVIGLSTNNSNSTNVVQFELNPSVSGVAALVNANYMEYRPSIGSGNSTLGQRLTGLPIVIGVPA